MKPVLLVLLVLFVVGCANSSITVGEDANHGDVSTSSARVSVGESGIAMKHSKSSSFEVKHFDGIKLSVQITRGDIFLEIDPSKRNISVSATLTSGEPDAEELVRSTELHHRIQEGHLLVWGDDGHQISYRIKIVAPSFEWVRMDTVGSVIVHNLTGRLEIAKSTVAVVSNHTGTAKVYTLYRADVTTSSSSEGPYHVVALQGEVRFRHSQALRGNLYLRNQDGSTPLLAGHSDPQSLPTEEIDGWLYYVIKTGKSGPKNILISNR